MRKLGIFALILALLGGPVWAEAVSKSPRPVSRSVPAAQAEVVAEPAPQTPGAPAAAAVPQPKPRPAGLVATAAAAAKTEPAVVGAAVASKLRPKPRPKGLAQEQVEVAMDAAPGTKKKKREKTSAKGSVCGDPAIKGVTLARVKSKVKGCGVEDPVSVTSVDGIRLSQPATLDCSTARALNTWVQQSMRPAFGNREVVQLQIAAHYICRPRNNIKGNKISEHGRGKAIDIAGFVFSDGKSWSIARDYNKQIRKAHKGACGIFGTTLGPGSDGYHEDHLHFDTASYRSGSYCR